MLALGLPGHRCPAADRHSHLWPESAPTLSPHCLSLTSYDSHMSCQFSPHLSLPLSQPFLHLLAGVSLEKANPTLQPLLKIHPECDVSREQHRNVYYLGWNRSPAQVGCMRQVLGPGALGRPRGVRWRGRWEGGSGWGIHVDLWLIHVNVWQKPLHYCTVISLHLIKINGK